MIIIDVELYRIFSHLLLCVPVKEPINGVEILPWLLNKRTTVVGFLGGRGAIAKNKKRL